jgi:hypothetical protein
VSPASPRPAADPDPDSIAAAVLGCLTVARLSGGIAGEVAAYLPGRRVTGLRITDTTLAVHVVGRYGPSMSEISSDVVRAVTPQAGGRQVCVVIDDLDDPAGSDGLAPLPGGPAHAGVR